MRLQQPHRRTISYQSQSKSNNKTNHRKKLSVPSNITTSQHLSMIYSDLAKKSLTKTYDLNNLRPYSTQTTHYQILQQLDSINAQNVKCQSPTSSNFIIQQINKVPLTNSRRIRTYHPSFKETLIQSQIEDQYDQLADNFLTLVKNDRKNKKSVRENLQKLVQKQYNHHTHKKNINLVQYIKQITNNNKVTHEYMDEQIEKSMSRKKGRNKYCYDFNKNDSGIYCITRNKGYFQELHSQRNLNVSDNNQVSIQKQLKPYSKYNRPKVYYNKYLRKYSDRKSLIFSGNYQQN